MVAAIISLIIFFALSASILFWNERTLYTGKVNAEQWTAQDKELFVLVMLQCLPKHTREEILQRASQK